MGVVLAFGRKRAFLRDGLWWSADPRLEEELNELTRRWVEQTGGPSLKSPDPEHDAAREIARRSHGRLILHAAAPGRRAHRIWFAQRQYKFAFR